MKLYKVTTRQSIAIVDVEGHEEELEKYGYNSCVVATISKTRKDFIGYVKSYSDGDPIFQKNGRTKYINNKLNEDAWCSGYKYSGEYYRVEELEDICFSDLNNLECGLLETGWDLVIFGDRFKLSLADDGVIFAREYDEHYDDETDIIVADLPELKIA